MFHFLRGLEDTNKPSTWKPFEGIDMTQILKSVTHHMTGVSVTVTDLRSAAESHVDIIGYDCSKQSENIQKALSYAEGHSENIAKMFYKRNGSSTIMKAWTAYVNKLMNFQDDEAVDDVSGIDQEIQDSINKSQEQWVKEVQQKLWRIQSAANHGEDEVEHIKTISVAGSSPRKRRKEWSTEEDEELRKKVQLYGEGNWKVILEKSEVLRRRYAIVSNGESIFTILT